MMEVLKWILIIFCLPFIGYMVLAFVWIFLIVLMFAVFIYFGAYYTGGYSQTKIDSDDLKPYHPSVRKKVKHRRKRKYAPSNDYSDTYDISKDWDGFGTSSDNSETMEDCPECQGVGIDDNGDPCPSCGGSGKSESLY